MKLTQAIVREFLYYKKQTGDLTWKWRDRKWFVDDRSHKIWNTRFAGKLAFIWNDGKGSVGYFYGRIFGKSYSAHRVIWLWMTGRWPNPEIDHINHNSTDNRWVNLREATRSDSSMNQSHRIDNTSGQIGVARKGIKYRAYVGSNGHQIFLGYFPTFQEAVIARKNAEREFGYHPNHGSKL